MTLSIASVFSGIGGIERGLEKAGHKTIFQCEILEAAQCVLKDRFKSGVLESDITRLSELPPADIITAGFPCQDLSQAGKTKGISGENSSLIDVLFDLLSKQEKQPQWVLLENVPFMLQLNGGHAMNHLTARLEQLGMTWAYRIVDARAFGLPQRRRRVVLLASKDHNPCDVLFVDDSISLESPDVCSNAYGFYWTEGNTGLGWTADGVPTLKGGSGIGIPCPPAIWLRDRREIVTPHIHDAERLQGFPAGWTKAALLSQDRASIRWKLVGNAVSVPVATWVGKRITNPGWHDPTVDTAINVGDKWPGAAWGQAGIGYRVNVSEWPKRFKYKSLAEFLRYPQKPLSYRATKGFYNRLSASSLRRPKEFDSALIAHIREICDL